MFNHRISAEASQGGWSEYTSGSGEVIYAIQPRLLPLLAEMLSAGLSIPLISINQAAKASGLIQTNDEPSGERARRLASSYVRDARFSRDVKAAYGNKCGLCGLTLGLVAGAHIYPVSAPGSHDHVSNGISLCHNHHGAFDAHKIWINSDFAVRINDDYLTSAQSSVESMRFLRETNPTLVLPNEVQNRPRREMLEARYGYFKDEYKWAPALS